MDAAVLLRCIFDAYLEREGAVTLAHQDIDFGK